LISQSALSRHVIALERLTGVQALRAPPHASPSPSRPASAAAVVKSFDRLEYALDDIRNEGAPVSAPCACRCAELCSAAGVPILRDFRRLSTEVDIDLISPYGVGPPLGDVDVAVVYSSPP